MSRLSVPEPLDQAHLGVPVFTGDNRHDWIAIRPVVFRPVARAIHLGLACAALALCMSRLAFAQQPTTPCSAVREHARDTVIVFQPPSTFTICREGAVEDDVVTGRPVYLQLAASLGWRMFDFRLHGDASEWAPAGLATWEQQARRISSSLFALEHSNESISDLSVPLEPVVGSGSSPLRPVAAARSRYLGVVTPRYREVLQGVRGEAREAPTIASVVRRWCGELESDVATATAMGAELRLRCAGPELGVGSIEGDVEMFEAAATKFDGKRVRAADATVAAIAHPEDPSAVSDASRALDEARQAADATVAASHALQLSCKALEHDVATLRIAIGSVDALRPGVPVYLSTYGAPGNAELQVDATPVDIATVSETATRKSSGKTTARFSIVGRHYIDIEAGLGVTGGLPAIPSIATQASAATIQGKPVDEFVGLALVELEPARFLWPDRPWAGVVRLPVLGVPFTRDPTQNFFVGAGLGWTGVGSITAGPYLLRELSLRSGYSMNEQLPAGTSLDAATRPALQVGYFVSASVDLLGLFHVFVPSHPASIDAATGKER
jgi:hypothetical protein